MGELKGVETKPRDWGGLCSVCELRTSKFPSKMADTEESEEVLVLSARLDVERDGRGPWNLRAEAFFSGKGRAKVWKWPWGVRRRTPPLPDLGSSGSGELSDPHEGLQGSSQTGVCPRRGGSETIDHTLSPQGLDCLGDTFNQCDLLNQRSQPSNLPKVQKGYQWP